MQRRFVRVLVALVTMCSVGIVLSGATADAVGKPAIASMRPITSSDSAARADSADTPSPLGPSPVHWQGGQRPHIVGHAIGSGTEESLESTNWSGYIASGTSGTNFSVVGADWTVPSVVASTAPEYSSQWTGIDGVLSTDLIQTGTVESTSDGATSYEAWYELLPAGAVAINSPVSPGDVMLATITEGAPSMWTISIKDQTQNWTYTNTFSYSTAGQTAEWIEEAPTVDGSQSTLADFGSTTFSALSFSGADTSSVGFTDVDMTNPSETIIAYPTPRTSSGFSVLYGTPQPTVTSISPASGSTAGGDIVTIEGNYLSGVSAVTFGGVEAADYINVDGFLLVTTPPEGAGTVPLVVTTPGGSVVAVDAFTYVAPPPPATTPVTTPVTAPVTSPGTPTSTHGYWLDGSDGGIFTFGSAQFYGSTGSLRLQRPIVGIVPTADKGGYWLEASDGGIFAFGDSGFHGSIPGLGLHPAGSGKPNSLDAPIVGMVPSADGGGYFMVASDGGVFAFGDARFAGSCPGIGGCAGAAVAVMPDASGNGYWLITRTGHVYSFGDAPYFGAPGPQSVPATSAVRTPDGKGYWILFANGSVDNFGDAGDFGGPSGQFGGLNPATAIFTTADGDGYWVVSANGAVDNYGDASHEGSMAGAHLNGSIIAATGW